MVHPNEQFIQSASDEQKLELILVAESLGPAYVAALKEQFTRLGVSLM